MDHSYQNSQYRAEKGINYKNQLLYYHLGFHLLAILGLILYPPSGKLIFLFLTVILLEGIFGTTLTYHRCLSHRAFQFKYKWMERIFVTLGALTVQRGPLWWCSIHRLHHRNSDGPDDPHNRSWGFWYSHMGWLYRLDPRWASHKKGDFYQDVVPDLASDPYYRWLDRMPNYLALPIGFAILLYLVGGWSWIAWGFLLPTVAWWHLTWSVNSLTHDWGYQRYSTKISDGSKNNWLVGFLAHGEGWHNNHHAFPSSARLGFFQVVGVGHNLFGNFDLKENGAGRAGQIAL